MWYIETLQSHEEIQIWGEQGRKRHSSTQVHKYLGHTHSKYNRFLIEGTRSYPEVPDMKGPDARTTAQNWERKAFP